MTPVFLLSRLEIPGKGLRVRDGMYASPADCLPLQPDCNGDQTDFSRRLAASLPQLWPGRLPADMSTWLTAEGQGAAGARRSGGIPGSEGSAP